jgi:hydrogenase maturation factor
VIVTKIEDFDEAMPIVHVCVGQYRVKYVLLNVGFSVNIISKSLRRKLRLRKLQLAPFVVRMVDQRKVQPIGLIRNLKLDLVGCEYKI